MQPAVKPAAVEQHKSALHSRIRAFLDASLNARGTDAIAQNEEAARKIITNEIASQDKSRFVNTLPPGRWSKMSWVERLEFLEPTLPTQEQLDAREAAAASRRKADAAERAARRRPPPPNGLPPKKLLLFTLPSGQGGRHRVEL